jgi:hypothetical protein
MDFFNRVKFTTATTGTDAITVDSAVSGFRTPAQAGIPDGTIFSYTLLDANGEWETGYGTYTVSGTTVSRNVRQSSNSDALIDLSGDAIMRLTLLAEEVGYQLLINESGASFSNFTAASGTWSSDGSVIKQTDTAASARRAKFNTPMPMDSGVIEAEMQLRSSGSERQAGFIMGFDGSSGGGMAVKMREGNNDVELERDGITVDLSLSTTIDVNTWYKVRIVWSGINIAIWKDGVLLGSGRSSSASGNLTYFGLITYQAEAWFRNIKLWHLPLP